MVKRREKAVFAIAEQVVERLARNPRPASDTTHRHPPIPLLRDNRERRIQQPFALRSETYKPPPRGPATLADAHVTPSSRGEAISGHPPEAGVRKAHGKHRGHYRGESQLNAERRAVFGAGTRLLLSRSGVEREREREREMCQRG